MTRIKICGITNQDDALSATYAGAWALGFVFTRKSPRFISPSKARKIIEALPPLVTPVGVFVDTKEGAVKEICRFTRIRTLQFHGDESPEYFKRFADFKVIKAFKVQDDFDFGAIAKFKVDAFLFDAYSPQQAGGTGKSFNWNLLKHENIRKPFILAGGLSAGNVKEALAAVEPLKPFAVDVSTAVEKAPGQKDGKLVKEFISAVTIL
jgi:phosphoribosylanthranilate isomerase